MPLFATLFSSLVTALVSFFVRYVSMTAALRLASYTAWFVVLSAYVTSVYICVTSLFGAVSSAASSTGGASWMSYFWMGVGMFIPSNAGAVLACLSSVWIASSVYMIQKQAFHTYAPK